FLTRKGLIDDIHTKEASYVSGEDCTLIGSRSGANAIAVWMILVKHGPFGWQEKIQMLQMRAEWICKQLTDMGITYFRDNRSNIVTINSQYLDTELAKEFGLVPDSHMNPKWFKIVIMEHVTIEKLIPLVERLREFQLQD
ncbi:MAG: aspartate aminotransferase family protein, partial [Flavicella sp.]